MSTSQPPEGASPRSDAAVSPAAIAASPGQASPEVMAIPLQPVVDNLPEALRSKVVQSAQTEAHIAIPLPRILEQLARGVVKISLGELRQLAPPRIFIDSNSHDQTAVVVPLRLIVPQLKTEHMARRLGQRQVVVPSEIGPPFMAAPAPAAQPAAAPPVQPPAPLPVRAAPPVQPPTPPPVFISQPLLPPKPVVVTEPVPAPPLATPEAVKMASAKPSTTAPEFFEAPLESIMNAWPEPVRQKLIEHQLLQYTLRLPMSQLEPGLKRGLVAFPWRLLQGWVQPGLATATPIITDDTPLTLPLSMIVPLFVAQLSPIQPQKKVVVPDHIPSLFVRAPSAKPAEPPKAAPPAAAEPKPVTRPLIPAPPPAPPAAALPSAPAPPVSPPVSPAPPPPPAPPLAAMLLAPGPPISPPAGAPAAVDLGVLFGQPGKSVWTPAEIVQKTSKLSGVSGALIALSDGLLVACQLPPALNGETIAAFLPQIFGRMSYYSRELKLGEPSSLTLVVDGVPIQIIKAGGLLLLVLGRAEEVLPGAQLAAVAAQLERQSKPG